MSMLTKDDILEINDIKIENVSVPEWGGEICVKSMTSIQRDKFETLFSEKKIVQ